MGFPPSPSGLGRLMLERKSDVCLKSTLGVWALQPHGAHVAVPKCEVKNV